MPEHAVFLDLRPRMGERDEAILRGLGRLEFVTRQWIKTLYFPDQTHQNCHLHIQRLLKRGLIWCQHTSIYHTRPEEAGHRQRGGPPPRAPYIYGLTPEGKEVLEQMDAESDESAYATLKTRDRRAPNVPEVNLTHDLLVSAWCVSMIDELRRCPMVENILCRTEYVSDPRQRIDALLIVRFNRDLRHQTRPGWEIPWEDGLAPRPEHHMVRWALEVDRNKEGLKIILGKAHTYRSLTAEGVYRKLLGGDVLTVYVASTARRAAQISREHQTGWPGGPGVISTAAKARHPEHGALWGEYVTLADDPAKRAHLLGTLVPTLDHWKSLTKDWVPGVPKKP